MTQVMPSTLKDAAKNWWSFEKGFKEWQVFTNAFVKAFLPLNYADLMKAELEKRSQDFDELLIS